MKKYILRRAGALVLALALALTLTAPAWASPPVPVSDAAPDQTARSLTVGAAATPGISMAGKDPLTADPGRLTLTAILRDADDGDPAPEITWTVEFRSQQKKTSLPELIAGDDETNRGSVEGGKVTITAGETVVLDSTNTGAGDFKVTAEYGDLPAATKNVTISGIVISGATAPDGTPLQEMGRYKPDTNPKKPAKGIEMLVNESLTLTVELFGEADDRGITVTEWSSSAPSTVSVMLDAGILNAWQLGKGSVITATKGRYSDQCTVDVEEDTAVIAGPYAASVSKPLKLSNVYPELKKMASDPEIKNAGDLLYITNLEVRTSQGTLYYNYVAESDTGAGVAFTDQFAETASGRTRSVDKLYFVPKPGFIGTAEITFSAIAKENNFNGIIRVNVGMGSVGDDGEYNENGENTYQISYRTRAGEPAWFMASDFNSFCQSETGRNFSSVTFSMPKSNEGVLYYNYMGGTGTPVTTTTRFTPSGMYTLDNVCFVPNAAFTGESVGISFRAVDSSGETSSGTVEITVAAVDVSGETSNVTVFGETGQPITLQSELFNAACLGTLHDTLSFVVFKLPDPKEGVLYYNYTSSGSFDSRVTATTRCYYSGVPALSGVTFVPGSGATGRIAIPYTAYGTSGTSFSGTLYISLDELDYSTIRYSVEKNGLLTFRASDFYYAGLYQKGTGVDHVTFSNVPGSMYYDYQSGSSSNEWVHPGDYYYVSPSDGGQRELSLISFKAEGSTGIFTVFYTAYDSGNEKMFDGSVVIQVGAIAAADVNLSCNTGGQAALSRGSLNSVCSPVLGESLSYIEITSIPALKEGRLYYAYSGFGTGTAVKPGNRFYYVGSPGIDMLTFIPYAGFTGEVEISYIGYGYSDTQALEQVSGRLRVNVSRSASSRYFSDMSGHAWAIDSVDYLYDNRTVNGIGGGLYNPAGTISKGDFTLMLVRAYGLAASGSASFYDVPSDSYYADAIRIAALLGVAGGTDGYYNPQTALSRQDAMLMIFNALKASGRTVTNGLAANLGVFYDENDIAAYAKEAVGSLVQMGVVEGDGNGYLRPRSLLSRAETAKLLHAIMTL